MFPEIEQRRLRVTCRSPQIPLWTLTAKAQVIPALEESDDVEEVRVPDLVLLAQQARAHNVLVQHRRPIGETDNVTLDTVPSVVLRVLRLLPAFEDDIDDRLAAEPGSDPQEA